MDSIENLANLQKALKEQTHQLEEYSSKPNSSKFFESVSLFLLIYASHEQIKELYETICKEEKEMEDLIFECVEVFLHHYSIIIQFYDIELPEVENYRKFLKDTRITVFFH